jgi:LacI family transcriptional regulator
MLHVARLGFRRNEVAADLARTAPTSTIGVLVPDVGDPFFASLVSGIEDATRAAGYLLLSASSKEDPDLERRLIDTFIERRVGGIIIAPVGDDFGYLAPEVARGLSVVFVDRPAQGVEADTVLVEHRQGAANGVQHLVDHGHERIAYIGHGAKAYTARERWAGYVEALPDNGATRHPELVRRDITDVETARLATIDVLAARPTAIFADNNRASAGVLKALSELSITDIAVIAFDDLELGDVVNLTVIDHDPRVLGNEASARLLGRLDGMTEEPETLYLSTRIIVRGSGEKPPAIRRRN